MSLVTLSVLALLILYAHGDSPVKCPFNQDDCQCTGSTAAESYTFINVTCVSKPGHLSSFTPDPSNKYKVTGQFILKSDVSTIPANQFQAFSDISVLSLLPISTTFPNDPDWDYKAFYGVVIKNFATSGLNNVLPPSTALTSQGANLKTLTVGNAAKTIALDGSTFSVEYAGLTALSIVSIPITITDNPFTKLTALTQLNLVKTSLTSVPPPIKDMKNLLSLNLAGNNIATIPAGTFSGDANDGKMTTIDLGENPITSLQDNILTAYQSLTQLNLNEVKLTSIDLTTFASPDATVAVNIVFDGSTDLKSITVTEANIDQIHPKAQFSIRNTGLQTIDSTVKTLLDRKANVKIDITDNINLQCSSLNWMADLQCPGAMTIDYDKCADKGGQSLNDYLKTVKSDSKCIGKTDQPKQSASSIGNNVLIILPILAMKFFQW